MVLIRWFLLFGILPTNLWSAGPNLQVAALRSDYQTGTPILFRVEADEDHYLYIFTFDERSGKMLLAQPENPDHAGIHFGGTSYTAPGDERDFIADYAGMEHLLFVASRERLPLPKSAKDEDFGLIEMPLAQTLRLFRRHGATCVSLDVFINNK